MNKEESVIEDEAATEVANLSLPEEPLAPPPEEASLPSFDSPGQLVFYMISNTYRQEFSVCEKSIKKSGVFIIKWTINENGYPEDITVSENTVGDKSFSDCMIRVLQTLRFNNVPKDYPAEHKMFYTYGEVMEA